jgi:predicted AlkP superfamily phosphohydrolase/phosphomutase
VIEPGVTGFVVSGRQDMAVCKAMDSIKARTSAAFHLMDKYAWDVFMLVYREIDVLQHYFWKYMDATHPDHVAGQAEKYGDVIFNCYRQLDEEVAKLLSRPGSDVSIVMLSDHIEAWRIDYNKARPHSSLGNLTPEEFVHQEQKKLQ